MADISAFYGSVAFHHVFSWLLFSVAAIRCVRPAKPDTSKFFVFVCRLHDADFALPIDSNFLRYFYGKTSKARYFSASD
jgi:hypothetical protein